MNPKGKGRGKDYEYGRGQGHGRGGTQSGTRRDSNTTSPARVDDRSRPETQAGARPSTLGHSMTASHGGASQAPTQAPSQSESAARPNPMSLETMLAARTQDLSLSGAPAISKPTNLPHQQSSLMQRPERDYRPPPQETLNIYREQREQQGQGNLAGWGESEQRHPTGGPNMPFSAHSSQSMGQPRAPPMGETYQVPALSQFREQERGSGSNPYPMPTNRPLQRYEGPPATGKKGRRDVKDSCLQCRRQRHPNLCDGLKNCSQCINNGKRCVYESELEGKDIKGCQNCKSSALCTGEETGCEKCENAGIKCVYRRPQKNPRRGKIIESKPCSNCINAGLGAQCRLRGPARSCGRCAIERLDNCEYGSKDIHSDRIGLQGPDLQPRQPPLNMAPGDTPGWIARELNGLYYSDWLLHPTKAPAGTQESHSTYNQGQPVGFDLRYNLWVYPPPRGVQDPLGSGRSIGRNMRMEWAYGRDYPGPGSVSGISTGPGTRMSATGESSGARPGEGTPQSHNVQGPSGLPALGRGGERSGGNTSRRRPAEDRRSGGGKDAKRGKPS